MHDAWGGANAECMEGGGDERYLAELELRGRGWRSVAVPLSAPDGKPAT
jgi:hypothetical protein